MDFYIQSGNPQITNKYNKDDQKLFEIIETVFPMNTENLIMYWNNIPICLSYKYDIGYMLEDIVYLLKSIRTNKEGNIIIHWLPDTFRTVWKLCWDEKEITIYAKWDNIIGNIEINLKKSGNIKMDKQIFLYEWKKPLKLIIDAINNTRYAESKCEMLELLKEEERLIDQYGFLYKK